jgi:hypothetical protein
LRRFALTVAAPLALLAGWGAWRGHTFLPALLGGLAGVLAGFALAAPGLLRPIHTVWMQGAEALGWLNTRLLLGLVYFLIMTPTGLLLRLLGRDPLDRQLRDRPSYWRKREPHPDPRGTLERQF